MAKTRLNVYNKRIIGRAVAKSVRDKHLDIDAIKSNTHRLLQAGYQHFFDSQQKHEAFQLLAKANLVQVMKSTDSEAMISLSGNYYDFRQESGSDSLSIVLGSKPFEISWHDAQICDIGVHLESEIKYPINLPEMMALSEEGKALARVYRQEMMKIVQAVSQHAETLRSLGLAILKANTAEALIASIPEIEDVVKASLSMTEPMSLPAVANTAQISSLLAGLKPIEVKGAAA